MTNVIPSLVILIAFSVANARPGKEVEGEDSFLNKMVQVGTDASSSNSNTGLGTKLTNGAKSVGNGIKSAAKSVWKFGRKVISKIPSILSKITSFFGKKR